VTRRQPDQRRSKGSPPAGDPDTAAGNRSVAEAIARRAGTLTGPERRRLGRWASATMRDPRLSQELNAARNEAQRVLEARPETKRYWERVSAPLYQALVASASEDRRYRLVMLAGHFVALLALVNLPAGLPVPLALLGVLAAPVSAWLAWGRGTAHLGAIHAALAAALGGLIDPADAETLRQSWRSAIETQPSPRPPLAGIVSAFAPSALLVVAFVAILVLNLR
jgi:hypothetical protein